MIGALPARFRQPRIGLVGFGDVGRRMLSQQVQSSQTQGGRLAFRLFCVARSLVRPPSEEDRDWGYRRDRKARSSLSYRQVVLLGWNLDDRRQQDRLAKVLTHWIVLAPPSESMRAGQPIDLRSRGLVSRLRLKRGAGHKASPKGVYISTTGVYGQHHGAEVAETSACRTNQPRSLRRLDAERAWQSVGFHRLRVPGITAEDKLPVDRIQAGARVLNAEDDVFTNHIHIDDLAHICWVALWRGRPGRVTNTVCEGPMPMGDYYDAVADAAGLPRPPRFSRSALNTAVAQGRVHPMTASFMQESRRVVSARRAKELRVGLRYPTTADIIQRRFRQ